MYWLSPSSVLWEIRHCSSASKLSATLSRTTHCNIEEDALCFPPCGHTGSILHWPAFSNGEHFFQLQRNLLLSCWPTAVFLLSFLTWLDWALPNPSVVLSPSSPYPSDSNIVLVVAGWCSCRESLQAFSSLFNLLPGCSKAWKVSNLNSFWAFALAQRSILILSHASLASTVVRLLSWWPLTCCHCTTTGICFSRPWMSIMRSWCVICGPGM